MSLQAKVFVLLLVISVALAATKTKPTPACAKACTDDYTPVCGSDGAKQITFGNRCVMDRAGCEQKKQYTVVNDGECKNGGGGVRLS